MGMSSRWPDYGLCFARLREDARWLCQLGLRGPSQGKLLVTLALGHVGARVPGEAGSVPGCAGPGSQPGWRGALAEVSRIREI